MARLLLIDDDEELRAMLATALGYAGHTVIQAADGRQGMDLVRAAPVDLVITDLIMPVQEGVETILQLRRERPGLPVIAISGGVSHSRLYLEIAGKMGATRILAKPFTPQEMVAAIRETLAAGAARPSTSAGERPAAS